MCKKYFPAMMALVAMLTVVALSDVAQAFPSFAVSHGNSCKGCHGSAGTGNPLSDRPSADTLAVLGEGLMNKDADRNDGNTRGDIPFFTVAPGGTVDLNMEVLNGADVYGVQLKRFEKAGVLGPADTDFLTGFTPDGDWFAQGPSDPGPPANTYYTNVGGFGGQDWAGSGPEPWTFTLTVDPNTPENTYDLEYAVAGKLESGPNSGLKFYSDQHFYLVVSSVPEPATLGLLAVAGLGICLLKRRG